MSGDDNGRARIGGVPWDALVAPWPAWQTVPITLSDGKAATGVSWRCVQERLDEVVKPWGWDCQCFVDGQLAIVTATITIRDGQITVSRTDCAGVEGEPMTPGWSDAVKTAATEACKGAAGQFGIGRELYEDPLKATRQATGVGVAPASAVGTTGDGKPVPSTGDIADVLAETQGVEHDHEASPVDPPPVEKADTATVAAVAITPAIGDTTACPKCAREFKVTGKTADRGGLCYRCGRVTA